VCVCVCVWSISGYRDFANNSSPLGDNVLAEVYALSSSL